MLQDKKDTLSARVAILINWLHTPEYAIYTNKESVTNLLKTIDIIRWSLDHTLTLPEWQHFDTELIAAENALLEEDKTVEQKEHDYNEVLAMIEATLRSYLEYINNGTDNQ